MRIPHTILVFSVFLAAVACASAEESPEVLPKVVQHGEPTYPPIARTAHIEGEVRVRVTTDGESVTNAEAESGPPILHKAAEDNVRTWKFVPHTAGTFHVTFRYKIMSGGLEVAFLETSEVVQLVAPPPEVIIDYAEMDLGKWKVQLTNPLRSMSREIDLYYSGPKGEWLGGYALSSEGKREDIAFGYKEGNLVGFTITLNQSKGRRVKTFLIGRMTGDKIVGTFVDDAGLRGEWTAVREADKSDSR
jgi:TonB family protein